MTTRGAGVAAARNQILDAAVDELLEAGLAGFNLQSVALRADVAGRTVYNHFPNRHELLTAAFARLADGTRDLVADVEAAPESPLAQLRSLIEQLFEIMEREGDRLTALLSLRNVEELDDAVGQVRGMRRDQLTRILGAIDREDGLALPLQQAVALAYTLSSHATWHTLRSELGLSAAATKRLVLAGLENALGISVGTERRAPRQKSRERVPSDRE
jgi:AcrR family transcriptional regulator